MDIKKVDRINRNVEGEWFRGQVCSRDNEKIDTPGEQAID